MNNGTVAPIPTEVVKNRANAVIVRNQARIDHYEQKIQEKKDRRLARSRFVRALFGDEPDCSDEQWMIAICEDAIERVANLIRLCDNTEKEIYLSPRDAAFIDL